MEQVQIKLTVFFDGTFWVGLFEREMDASLSVRKVIFGSEPTEREVDEWIQLNYSFLSFAPALPILSKELSRVNPKRRKRLVNKQMKRSIATHSQQVLQLQLEQKKKHNQEQTKIHKEEQKKKKFAQKQQKKYQKHRGH